MVESQRSHFLMPALPFCQFSVNHVLYLEYSQFSNGLVIIYHPQLIHLFNQSVSQPVTPSVNQAIDQSISQLINQPYYSQSVIDQIFI